MSVLSAQAIVAVADPEPVVEEMCEHFSEDGAFITGRPGARMVTFDFGSASLTCTKGQLIVDVEADDLIELYNFRWTMAQHIGEFAGTTDFEWTGAASDLRLPPYFRLLTVAAVQAITPHMKRVTFSGENLAPFATDEELHIRLYLPRGDSTDAEWPSVGKNGIPKHPSGDRAPVLRRYTIRQVNLEEGTLDVDFVLHNDAGPGSAFAERAQIGGVIGMSGPGGGSCPIDRDWYLLAGDETALPAIARMLEFLPSHARGIALIEVAGKAEEQLLHTKADFAVRWLHRDRETNEGKSGLPTAVKAVAIPDDGSSYFVWFAGEFNAFREIRSYLRKDKGLKKQQHLVVSYWRQGEVEDAGEGQHGQP